MPGKHFFATKADMEQGLRTFEAQWKVKYVETGFRPYPEPEIYSSAFGLPNFGFSAQHSIIVSPEYLVFPREATVIAEPVRQQDGEILYLVDWQRNPGAFRLCPGGWYENRVLIGGNMGARERSGDILAYYRPFARAVTRGFTIIPDWMHYKWWVGPEALTLLDSGIRLITRDLNAPGTHGDLKRP